MGVKAYIMADNKGLSQPTNQDYKDEGTESQTSKEEVSEKEANAVK